MVSEEFAVGPTKGRRYLGVVYAEPIGDGRKRLGVMTFSSDGKNSWEDHNYLALNFPEREPIAVFYGYGNDPEDAANRTLVRTGTCILDPKNPFYKPAMRTLENKGTIHEPLPWYSTI